MLIAAPQLPDVLTKALKEEEGAEDEEEGIPRDTGEDGDGTEEEESESDSDDDLMINLDENATDYEPSQSKFQKSFQPPGLGSSGVEGASIPGLGGATTRVAIGGIPRSAIPGLAVSFAAAAQHQAAPRDPRRAGDQGQESQHVLRIEDAVFPSEWKPGLPIKLPGQTRVSPEEYKEFLSLGHGEIFSIDLDSVIDAPWRLPGTDPSDFFNFGMNMNDWKAYQDRVRRYRLEFTMKGQIQTFDQSQAADASMWQNTMFMVDDHDGQDRSLQASMLDARDGSYEAFVTSERPERASWQRFGSPWDHTIVLTGFHLDFGDSEPQKSAGFNPNMTRKPNMPGVRPPGHFGMPRPPVRPGFQPPPPGMGGAGVPPPPFMGMPQYGATQARQGPKLGLGMDYDDKPGGGRFGNDRGRGRGGRFGNGERNFDEQHNGRREDRYKRETSPDRGTKSRYSDRRDDRYGDRDRRSDRRERDRDGDDSYSRRDRDRRGSRREREDRRYRSRSPVDRRRRR